MQGSYDDRPPVPSGSVGHHVGSRNPFGDMETCRVGNLLEFGGTGCDTVSTEVGVSTLEKATDSTPILGEETTSLMNELSLFFGTVPSSTGAGFKVINWIL